MKRNVFFLMMIAIVISQVVFGQDRESCIKYKKDRTMKEFSQIILEDKDPFISRELWPAYAKSANEILQTSKIARVRELVVSADLKGMTWLMEHSYKHEKANFEQSEYLNGVKVKDKLIHLDITGQESDWVALEYEDVIGMYAKIACGNSEWPKTPREAYVPPTEEPKAEPKEKVPEDQWTDPEENTPELECLVESFIATPDTVKKGEKSIISWDVRNATYVRISGFDNNLKLMGSMEVHPLFKGRQKSVMYTMDVYKDNKLCKTQMVFVYRQDKTWLGKNWPLIAGTVAGTVVGVGFIAHGDGIWYGLGDRGNIVPPEEEFHHVDALPQARLPQKRGFNPNLTLGFHF